MALRSANPPLNCESAGARQTGSLDIRKSTTREEDHAHTNMASDILETNRDRKNRKNAEKINIRVEGSFLEEGDGRRNRIAAALAKCKENKARRNFYQGQALE
jgi:hypothetical protein